MAELPFKLPDLGEGLEDAEVVRWLVAEGDKVVLNQPLVEVDTAKALVEIPSPLEGTIARIHAAEGETVMVGAPLVTFDVDESQMSDAKRTAVLVGYGVDEATKPTRRRRLNVPKGSSSPAIEASRGLAAPPVRRLAQETGVDIDTLIGSGPGGRILREDVLAAAGPASEGEGLEERIAVRGVRKLIAEKMVRSASEIPHVTTYLTVDATSLMSVQDQLSAQGKVSALGVISKAFIEICKKHSKLNATWDSASGEIVLKRQYHLGIATDTERGLIVPVVRNADRLSFGQLTQEIARLASDAREARSSIEDLSGGTVTISNVGSFGAEYGTPIINYPESSILAVGVIEDRPVARGNAVDIRPMATLSLSFDHRILDGAEAGRALMDLKGLLEDDRRLLEL